MSDSAIRMWLFLFAAIQAGCDIPCVLFAYLTWKQSRQRTSGGSASMKRPKWLLLTAAFATASCVSLFVLLYIALRAYSAWMFILSLVGPVTLLVLIWIAFIKLSKVSPRKLVIRRAVYGAGRQTDTDITASLQNAVQDGLVIPVDNNLVPRDLAIGSRKRLEVEYSYGNGTVCYVYRLESTKDDFVRLVLPEDSELIKMDAEIKRLKSEKQGSADRVFVFISVVSLRVDEKTVARGKTLKIRYVVNSSENIPDDMWLGASFWDNKRGKSVFNVHQDKPVSLLKGTHEYDRDLTIPADVSLGNHMLQANIWRGVVGDSTKSSTIATADRIEIVVVAY
jgi:hypothetical protein